MMKSALFALAATGALGFVATSAEANDTRHGARHSYGHQRYHDDLEHRKRLLMDRPASTFPRADAPGIGTAEDFRDGRWTDMLLSRGGYPEITGKAADGDSRPAKGS